jgi:hypothetical protein
MQSDFAKQGYISNKCLSQGLHLCTRRNVVVELHIEPKYMLESGTVDTALLRQNLDWKDGDHPIYKVIPKDAYSLEFFNPKDGSNLSLTQYKEWRPVRDGVQVTCPCQVDVVDGFDYILRVCDDYFKANINIGNAVNEACALYFTQMMDSETSSTCEEYQDAYNPLERMATQYHCVDNYANQHSHPPVVGDLACPVCDLVFDPMYLESHIDVNHPAFRMSCDFCNYSTPFSAKLVEHVVNVHKLPLSELMGAAYYCCECKRLVDATETHPCSRKVVFYCDGKRGTDILLANNRISRNFLNFPIDHIDVNTINFVEDSVQPSHARRFFKYLEKLCPMCLVQYNALIENNGHLLGPIIRNILKFEGGATFDGTDVVLHRCPNSFEDLCYEEPESKMSSLLNSVLTFFGKYTQGWLEFVKTPIFIAISSIVAIAGVVALAWNYLRDREEDFEDQKGSGSKKVRRAKAQRERRAKRSKGSTAPIHEISNRSVVIGKGGLRYDAESYNNSNEVLEKAISKNIGIAELVLKNFTTHMEITEAAVSFVNLYNSVLVIPKHFMDRIHMLEQLYIERGVDVKLFIKFTWTTTNKEKVVPVGDIRCINPVEDLETSGHLTDVMFLYVPGLAMGRDICSHFVSMDDEVNLHASYLYGYRSATNNRTIQLLPVTQAELKETEQMYTLRGDPDPFYKQKVNEKQIVIPEYYWYRSDTIGGDCGMLFLHADSTIPRKLLGIHVAGSSAGKAGIANPIFKEDLDDLKDYLKTNFECQASITMKEGNSIFFKDQSVNPEFAEAIQELVNSDTLIGGMEIEGARYYIRPNLPGNSGISRSVMYNSLTRELGNVTTVPARLRPFTDGNGEKISPFMNALKKMQSESPYLSRKYVQEITDHIISTIRGWNTTVHTEPRLLTEKEIFNGMPGLNPVDVTTSGGYPFKVMSPQVGKTGFVNTTMGPNGKEYSPTEQLRRMMLQREDDARLGLITETIFFDTLKDETREIPKVNAGKTRMFQIGPMDLLFLTRKYCGMFIAHCHTSYLEGEMAIGINPYSDDWDILARRMIVFEKFLNGDYSNFDATIGLGFVWMIIDIINGFYDDSAENQLIRAVLILTCFISWHLAYDVLYVSGQGNPSGCLLTTIFNCLVNMILIRLAYLELTGLSLSIFHLHVMGYFYGDDNLVGLSERVASLITMAKYAALVRKYGFLYTTTDKSDISKDHYTFSEVSFLTNDFVWVKTLGDNIAINKYLARLDLDTIHDIAYWSHSDPNNMRDQLGRINMSLYYLRNHGLKMFTKYRKAYILAVRDAHGKGHQIRENEVWDWRRVMRLYDSSTIVFHDLIDGTYGESAPILRESELDMVVLKHCSDLDQYGSTHQDYLSTNKLELFAQMDVEQITTFVEEAPVTDMNENVVVEAIQSTSKEVSLDAFIKRPYLIQTVAWPATAVIGTNLMTIVVPDALYAIPTFREKLDKFAFWAPDVEITIRVNGTGLHYGRLVAFWIPQANKLSPSFTNWKTAFTHRWEQVDANASNDITIKIPYTYYSDLITIGKLEDDIATLYVNVSVPLTMLTSAASSIYITSFIRVVEPNLRGYSYGNDYVTQMGMYADVVRGAGQAVSSVAKSIGLQNLSVSSAKYTGLVANVLDYLGYSTPVSISTTSPMQIMMPRLNKIIDTPNATNLAIVQDAAIKDENERMYFNENENDIAYFCGRPSLLYTGTLTSTRLAGDNLYVTRLHPLYMFYSDYTGPAVTPFAFLPMNYICRNFKFWRGGMKFTISFINSNFHNARFRIWYEPYIPGVPNPSEQEAADMENIVFDLSEQSEVTFTIPYQQTTEWRTMDAASNTFALNGWLGLQLLNPLTSGYVPVNPIYYQVFVSACADFQVATPTQQLTSPSYYIAQSGMARMGTTTKFACSMDCLRKAEPICLGKPVAKIVGRQDQVNIVSSILSLVKLSALFKSTTDKAFEISPWTAWNLRVGNPTLGPTILARIEAVFRYKKGGYRMTILPSSGGIAANNLYSMNFNKNTSTDLYTTIVPATTFSRAPLMSGGFALHTVLASTPYDVIIPFNSPFKLVTTQTGTVTTYTNNYHSVCLVNLDGTNTEPLNIFLSAADDYRLSFQLGIPLCSAV